MEKTIDLLWDYSFVLDSMGLYIWKYFRDQYIVAGHHLQLTSLEDFQTHFVSPIFASKPHLL